MAIPNQRKPGRREKPSQETRALSGRKLWLFRLLTLLITPAVGLGIVELILRLVGYGYPTDFLLKGTHNGQNLLVQNNQFGWRFFGPRMERLPEPISILPRKTPGTIRIFILGESAAQGDPQPAFGPARMLQAILSQRYPGAHFELVNAAMTAINSHTIVPIARSCANADSDIWVIYMGNNEVVGPFGAGTVFGQKTPPVPLVRTMLALKATRTGQLLDSVRSAVQRQPLEKSEWRGMEMFLDQQVPATDPSMRAVYRNFQWNLADILQMGKQHGVGIVVSTVPSNLRDCPPFASAHRAGLSETEKASWEKSYQLGIEAQIAGQLEAATQHLKDADGIEGGFAELHFRQGQCALALGQVALAQEHFRAARDLDTLRFRCDGRLNELIRQTASNRETERILLADTERAFTALSPDGLPGADLFYEHVHLTFKGNYLLAISLAEQVEKLLPRDIVLANAPIQHWPSEAECAQRLGWSDWSLLAALDGMFTRIASPPFTQQLNHEAQLQSIATQMERLAKANQPSAMAETRRICEAALAANPDDATLHGLVAALKLAGNDLEGAAESTRRRLDLIPSNSQAWMQLGVILSRQRKVAESVAAFRRAIELDPGDVMHRQNLAQSLWMLGQREDAITELRRAVSLQPNFALGWISLGQLFDELGRNPESEECYRRALAGHPHRTSDLVAVARLCRSRGRLEAAATNFSQAVALNPRDASIRLEAGQTFLALKRPGEAARLFSEALRLAPDSAPAHQLYGLALGQQGNSMEAAAQFREALRLGPDLVEARLNLGVALMNLGRPEEALVQFEDVLKRSPTNALALNHVRMLRGKPR